LPHLSDGVHRIVIYASDMARNVGASDVIHFTVDTSPPSIRLLSPQNQTYTTTEVLLDFMLNETASWTAYSLDGQEPVTTTGNISLTDLASGSHTITVYAKDAYSNMVASEIMHFSVAEPFPTVLTAALTTVIVACCIAVLLLHFRRTGKATKKPNGKVQA
jgi:hypothetical protein